MRRGVTGMSEAPGDGRLTRSTRPTRSFRVLVYPSLMQVSNRALQTLADALRHHRRSLGSRWRRLPAERQALLVCWRT
jgi:hypothetical protein